MNISINIKSGTGGHYDYDGCDLRVKEINQENFPIPRIGETLLLLEDNDGKNTNAKGTILKEYHEYLITNICYWIIDDNSYGVIVYVIPIGRKA